MNKSASAMNPETPRRWFASDFFLNMLATLVGVLLAFWLTEWASDRDFKSKERHLLQEVHHELSVNLKDLQLNLNGHHSSIASTKALGKLLTDPNASMDTLYFHYIAALRDFTSIQHTAAYETLKSRGVESVTNDSLRTQIADLYDFDFESIQKIEEEYSPHEFFEHYNEPILQSLAKCFDFGATDKAKARIMPLTQLPAIEKNLLNARLRKLIYDRQFSIMNYEGVIKKLEKTLKDLETELAKG
ncbi:MAG: hypothetical protein IT258_03070 [Saprospiraceae bacterium]|nr:hypothetical protein [Saprospiraceae bacterium]